MSEQNTDNKLNQAIELILSGQTEAAITELKELINQFPENDKILYFLALGYYKNNELPEAVTCIDKVLELNKDVLYLKDASDIYFDFALHYSDINDLDNAVKYYEKCLSLNPDDKDALKNIAICCLQKDRPDSAAGYFLMLTELDPASTDAYLKLASIYEKSLKTDKAINIVLKALEFNANDAQLLLKAGLLFSVKEEYDLAAEYFYKSYRIMPDNAQTCYNLGLALYNGNKKEESIPWYERAVELNPKLYEAYLNLGLSYCSAGRYDESLQMYRNALELRPDSIEIYMNMAVTYFYKLDDKTAENCYNKAYKIDPDNIETIVGQGFVYQFRNELEQAEEFYKKALTKDKEHPYANFNMGNIHLLKGNFKKGWDLYEYRFKLNHFARPYLPKFQKPEWKGESLKGKTLYIYPEQGFGDALQLARFFPGLAKLAGKVIFKAKPALMKLFNDSDLGIDFIEGSFPESKLDFDYYIPLMSLPGLLDINTKNIPFSSGYLKPDKELVKMYREKYFANDLYKVGIFWQGNPKGLINRMIPLEKLLPLTEIEGVQVYSFQKGYGIEQLKALPSANIKDLGSTFNSFADTTAAMENLDIMVSVDTGITHISGAIGKRTLLMLAYASEWRWLQDIDYSPWYDSIKLIRQTEHKNWDTVVEKVCKTIKEDHCIT